MDLANQSKAKSYFIAVLLVVNLLAVSVIWMQTARENPPPGSPPENPPQDAVGLMQRALDLNEEQTDRFRELRKTQLAPAKSYNDRLDALKLELAEELLKARPDTALARAKALEIGGMQSRVEIIRFDHFRQLLALCSPEQRDKMAPVIRELYSRKPPQQNPSPERRRPDPSRPDPSRLDPSRPAPSGPEGEAPPADAQAAAGPQPAASTRAGSRTGGAVHPARSEGIWDEAAAPPPRETSSATDDRRQGVPRAENPGTADDRRQGPPSIEEKLARLSQRLDLSDEQSSRLRQVLESAQSRGRQAGEGLDRNSPEFAAEREKIRREEDEAIMRILTPPQRQEYQRMIERRSE